MHFHNHHVGALVAVAVVVVGVGVMIGNVAFNSGAEDWQWSRFLTILGAMLIVVGALTGATAMLGRRGRDLEEAYRLGYDLGYEAGDANHRIGRIA